MNRVIQTVTFAVDPQTSTYGDGKTRVTFGAYVKKRFKKDGEKDNSFQYVAFGSTADFIAKYFKKGSKALISGEINNNNYEKDGVTHYGVQILVDNVEFFGSKADNESTGSNGGDTAAPAKKPESKPSDNYYDEYADF